MTPDRPVLRWHGGKWRLAPWIISHFPAHRVYVEPFGGAGSVLLRKPRCYGEVWNDLDAELVNLFCVLRDPEASRRLIDLVRLTPWARDESRAAYEPAFDTVERARRLVARSFMGFGSDGTRVSATTGFRSNSNRSGTTPAHDWANYPPALAAIVERVIGVVIENRDALACMAAHDGPTTLHYVDPPYLPETRQMDHRDHGYNRELSAEDHHRLLPELRRLTGMVIVSGYASSTYDAALAGWERREISTYADGARPRVECLWLNPATSAALERAMPSLFGRGMA